MLWRRLPAVALGTLLCLSAACQDQGPGSLSDPSAVSAELEAVDSAFGSAAFQSYGEVSSLIAPVAAGALRHAAVIVEGSTPTLAREPVYLRGTKRADAWRQLVPHMAELSAGPIIPAPVMGTTFEWDTAGNQYAATTRTGAPTNGVRFILYTVNSITHVPVEPVVEVGYVDLMDESTTGSLRLHIQVKGVGGTPTYLDYTAAIVASSTSFTATVNGNLSNGLAAAALKTLGFNVQFQVSQNAVTESASYDLNNPSVSVDVYLRLTASAASINVAVDFRFARPGELVRLLATVTLSAVNNELVVSGTVVVTVNGGVYARATAAPGAEPVWVRHDGTPLDANEVAALQRLFHAVERFFNFTTDLLDPVDELIA
jgi:hypothetical protein